MTVGIASRSDSVVITVVPYAYSVMPYFVELYVIQSWIDGTS